MKKHIYTFILIFILGKIGVQAQTSMGWFQHDMIAFPVNGASQPTGIGRISSMAFDPKDSLTIYAVSPNGGIWKTENGAKTWYHLNTETMPQGGIASIAINPLNPQIIYIGCGDADYYGGGFGVWKSTNGGKLFVQSTSGMGNRLVRRFIINPADTAMLLAACDDGIYKSINGGATWSKKTTGTIKFRNICLKANYGTKTVYAVSFTGFYKSTDLGETWKDLTTSAGIFPADTPTTKIIAMDISVTPADSEVIGILAVDNNATNRTFNGYFRSTNGGTSFTRMSEAANPPTSIRPNILGYDYTNNGASSTSQGAYNLAVTIDPLNANIVYTGSQNCWRSTDAGATWKLRSCWGCGTANGLHADHHDIHFNPYNHNQLYIAHDGGVSRTYIYADSIWEACSDGLAVTEYYKMSQSPIYKEAIFAGTQDNGLQFTLDGNVVTIQGGDYANDFEFDYFDQNHAYANRTQTRYSVDKSKAWNYTTKNIVDSFNFVGSFFPSYKDSNTFFLYNNNNIYINKSIRSANASSQWQSVINNWNNPNSYIVQSGDASKVNKDIVYIARGFQEIVKINNINGTPTFNYFPIPTAPINNFYVASDAQKDSVCYYVTGSKVFRLSANSGYFKDLTYNLNNQPIYKIIVDLYGKNEDIYVLQVNGVYYNNKSQNTWTKVSDGIPTVSRFTDMELFPDSTGKGFLRVSTFGRGIWQGGLYHSKFTKPIADFKIELLQQTIGGNQFPANTCENTYILSNQSLNNPSKIKWKISPATGWKWENKSTDTSNIVTIQFTKNGDYSIQLYAENLGGNDSITKIVTKSPALKNPSCVPTTNINPALFGMGITGFSIDSNLNTSAPSAGKPLNWQDFSCRKNYSVNAGKTHNFNIRCFGSYPEYAAVYIDFNNDGVFASPNERIFLSSSAQTTHSFNYTFPLNPFNTNTFLRLRIITDYIAIAHPCSSLNRGSVEDYAIRILPWPKPNCILNPVYPKVGDTTDIDAVTLKWDSAANASYYIVQLDTGAGFYRVDSTKSFNSIIKIPRGKYISWKILPGNFVGTNLSCGSFSFYNLDTAKAGLIIASDTCLCKDSLATLQLTQYNGSIQWQELVGANWTDLSGKTSNILKVSNGSYRAIVTYYNKSKTTSAIQVNALSGQAGIWTGLISADWNDCKNWSSGTIPDSATNVYITLTPNQPIISGNAYSNDIKADSGTIVRIQIGELNTFGNIYNLGKIYTQTGAWLAIYGNQIKSISSDSLGNVRFSAENRYTLQKNIAINQLRLEKGKIDLNGWDCRIYQINGMTSLSNKSYIITGANGYLIQNLIGSAIFHVGTDSLYTPITLSQTSYNGFWKVNIDDTLYHSVDYNSSIPLSWKIEAETKNTTTCDLLLEWDSIAVAPGFNDLKSIIVVQNGSQNFPQFPPQNIRGKNKISGTNITMPSIVFVNSGYAAEPVVWNSFNAIEVMGNAKLNWETKTEYALKNFRLERSADSLNFTLFYQTPAGLLSAIPKQYETYDSAIAQYQSPKLYYRLSAIDTLGNNYFFGTRLLQTGLSVYEIGNIYNFSIYPNPFTDYIILETNAPKNFKIQVTDLQGKSLFEKNDISGQSTINTENWAKGIYILMIEDGDMTKKFKVMKW